LTGPCNHTGIANDFNYIFGAFIEYCDLVMMDVDKQSPEPASEKEQQGPAQADGQHVLVVDDETIFVEVRGMALEHIGRAVTTCVCVEGCAGPVQAANRKICAGGLRYNHTRHAGDRFGHELKAIRSDIPIILCTGYSENLSDLSTETHHCVAVGQSRG
jgi:hypothetical protein